MGGERDWRRSGLRALIGVVVLVGAYLALAWWSSTRVPSSASVEGVQVGGLSPEQARERLAKELAAKAAAPVQVKLGDTGTSITVDPAAAGLALDIPATLDGLSGFTLDPVKVWSHLTGTVDRPVLISVDRAKLDAVVTEKAAAVRTAPVEAAVSFAGGTLTTTAPKPGVALDVDDAVDRVVASWPRQPFVTAKAQVTEPAVGQAALDEALRGFATPAMSGPVTVVVGDRTSTIAPAQFAAALGMKPEGGKLVPVIDKEALKAKVVEATAGFGTAPVEAKISLVNGSPSISPSSDGVKADTTNAADLMLAAFAVPDRRLTLPTTVAKPALTTEQAQALGVKEIVASFDSAFPNDGPRTTNIITACNTINGTLLKPGETFSMNGILGQRTVAKGYGEANTIVQGRLVPGVGGGISQVSTVLLNLSYFAGLELVEHTAHMFYISRYPEGREATVNWPDVDNKFRNNTQYGVLIQLYVSGNAVHGRVWSTKQFDVTSVKGPRTALVEPKTIYDPKPACIAQSPVPGFTVTVTRTIRRVGSGELVKQDSMTTRYIPEDRVICAAQPG